jgi:peroxiredoxin (alkyl hydroperoxide reductase subunit C)
MIGLSANDLKSHVDWIKGINELSKTGLQFPIIVDADRKVSFLYDLNDRQKLENNEVKGIAFTIRSIFIIDPVKTIWTIMLYPASVGKNSAEGLWVIDTLQLGGGREVTTPIDRNAGLDVRCAIQRLLKTRKKQFVDVREVTPIPCLWRSETDMARSQVI